LSIKKELPMPVAAAMTADDAHAEIVPAVAHDGFSDRESNTLRAYRELRNRVFTGAMPPGAQYLEQELAAMLGMSRTPVREALIRLADERLVEVRPRHGARVLSISSRDMADIYELVAELEALAARRLAANGPTAGQLAALEAAVEDMRTALAANDRTAWAAGDRMFHAIIVTASGNERLAAAVEGLLAQSHWARECAIDSYVIGDRSDREHGEIISALRNRNANAAADLVQTHRAQGGRAMAELVAKAQGR
jgi:DNA-binding GntR family transcriptional regulator